MIDLNAVDRQPALAALIERDAADLSRRDPQAATTASTTSRSIRDGEIGLVTTGAGLSMMLIDEMTARGGRPLNFCDIRTGLLRGDPTRLIKVLGWIGERPSVRVVLVNIFAGITDLPEFANLLCIALERTPPLKVPVVAASSATGSPRRAKSWRRSAPTSRSRKFARTAALDRVDANPAGDARS